MPKKRQPRKKKAVAKKANKTVNNGRSQRWFKRFIALLVLIAIPLAVYLVYLDVQIVKKFSGKKWAIPARVYAQPLDLYVGKKISQKQFETELHRLSYQKLTSVKLSGTYAKNRQRYHLRTRGFQFDDGFEASRWVSVRFSGDKITSIKDKSSRDVPLMRLAPTLIGSIYPNQKEDRILLDYQHLPEGLVAALLVTEDQRFFQHHGVSITSILRALWANIRAGKTVQGGSTITQQLVKNYFLTNERSLIRKVNEALMSLLLEIRYSKEEILEAYINEIYLGQDGKRAIHGFGMASYFYFGRPVNELKLPELALLAGIIKGPSYYSPRKHPQRAKKRRDLVLTLMQKQALIPAKLADKAKASPLSVNKKKQYKSNRYPAFLQLVKQQLRRDYNEKDLQSEGLRIFTTLRPDVQDQAQKSTNSRLALLEKSKGLPKGSLQASVIVTSRDSGEVEAVVGGRNFLQGDFNRALYALRPVGSLIKPAIYLAALNQPSKYSLMTTLEDKKIKLKQQDGSYWQPQNYDKKEHGMIPLHDGLTYSHNLSTIRLGLDIKVSNVTGLLGKMGVKQAIPDYPSTLLGAVALPPIEIAQFYQTIASGGFYSPLSSVRSVVDQHNQALTRYPLSVEQVVDNDATYLLNVNLQEVVQKGTAKSLAKRLGADIKIAGKTGTTDDLRDSWFAGFDDRHVMVTWIGRDDNKPAKLTGASGALRLWGDILNGLGASSLRLTKPDNITVYWIDSATGLLADEDCSNAVKMPFIENSQPSKPSSCIQNKNVADDLMDLVSDWF